MLRINYTSIVTAVATTTVLFFGVYAFAANNLSQLFNYTATVSALDKNAKNTSSRQIAVLPTTSHGAVSKEIKRAIEKRIEHEIKSKAATPVPAVVVAEKLKGTPAVERCNAEVACLARLAGTLKVDAVVLISVKQLKANRNQCKLKVVASSGRLENQATVEINSLKGVDKALAAILPDFFKPETAIASASTDDLELVPLIPLPTEKTSDSNANQTQSSSTSQATETTQDASNASTSSTASSTTNAGNVIAPTNATTTPTTNLEGNSHILSYVGIGAGAVTLGLFGTSLYYYLDGMKDYDKANNRNTPQPIAAKKTKDYERKNDLARTLAIIGGATAVISASLFAVDLFWLNNPTTSVSIAPDGVSTTFTWTF
ncbi:MAG: hypothetical protein JW841_04675 [Deltaproteobacteria bacterium]|nr:hypothetical protein [Deltaproteobacteria bacterium]